jgi:hypothetical protein
MRPRNGDAIDNTEFDVIPSRLSGGGTIRVLDSHDFHIGSVEHVEPDVRAPLLLELLGHSLLEAKATTPNVFVYRDDPSPMEFTVHVEGSVIVGVDQQESLVERVTKELNEPAWDFRTVSGLARSLGETPEAIEAVLDENPQLVRWVAATDTEGEQLLVSPARPVTREERYLVLRSALTKSFR